MAKSGKKAEKSADETKPAKGKAKSKAVEATAKPAKGKSKADKGNGKVPEAKTKGKAAKAVSKADNTEKKARESKVVRDKFGFKEGSLKSQAAAMYSSKKTKGATLSEVKEALNSSQLNLLKQLEESGYKINKSKEAGSGKKQVTRYQIVEA